ncbi:hypothetical protein BaRGS_00035395 [Batillaria attramentaria]|uniref:Glycine N-acyltransferase-like protein n=1 Tax=Batillaria attramentaria TaxID=370345 RepID=A0ABD0JEK7_9CAEN
MQSWSSQGQPMFTFVRSLAGNFKRGKKGYRTLKTRSARGTPSPFPRQRAALIDSRVRASISSRRHCQVHRLSLRAVCAKFFHRLTFRWFIRLWHIASDYELRWNTALDRYTLNRFTQGQAVHLKELQELEEQDSTMIYKLLSNEEVVELKKELRHDLPGSAKMFYILSNFLQGLMAGFEVIVDHWPSWQCIILRPESPDAVPSYFRHYNICHTRSVKAFRFFIQRPCVIDWNKPVCFTGVPYDALPTLQEQSRKHGGRLSSVENRFMYAWTKSEPPEELPVPEGYTLTRLTAKDAPALCERWKHYRPDPALDLYMQVITEQFDSSAIVTKEGQLVAYIGMQFNGAMAMLHVDPNYRGRGLGQIVLVDLTRKLLAKGNTAYGLIPTKDTSFIATSSQKLGFTWVPQGSMAWARYLPKSSSPTPVPASSTSSTKSVTPDSTATSTEKLPCKSHSGGCVDEGEGAGHLFLTALPLSCNECADISNDPVTSPSHVRVGIS